MCCKMLYRNILMLSSLLLPTLIIGCSTLENLIYRPDINQGNYISDNDVKKIEKGMTQQQISYILGTPMLHDPFGKNTWFYIFRQQNAHKKIKQRTIILFFNSKGILINIEKQTF